MVADFVDDFLGRGRADIRLRAGAEALGDLGAHLHDALRLGHGERLRVGIGDDEIDPCNPAVIMLLTALPPLRRRRIRLIRGLSSRMSGTLRLMVMVASRLRARWFTPADGPRGWWKPNGPEKIHQKPSRSHRPTFPK